MEMQRCFRTTLPPSRYQNDVQNVLYSLYGGLLVQFLGEELTVLFTYFYLRYGDGGMTSVLPAWYKYRTLFAVTGQPVEGVPFYVCLPTKAAPHFWMYAFRLVPRLW